MKNYYDILEIQPTASEAEIKTAYRRLARSCHPDVAGEKFRARFDEITEAYKLLTDRISRLAYDVNLRYESVQTDGTETPAAPFSAKSAAVGVRRKKVKSTASTLFAAYAGSAEKTDTAESVKPQENKKAENVTPANEKTKGDKPAGKKTERTADGESAKNKRTSAPETYGKNENVRARDGRKKTAAALRADSDGEAKAENRPSSEKAAYAKPHAKKELREKKTSARKIPKADDAPDVKKLTPSARLKQATEYICVLEDQLGKYEELIHALTRCSVTPPRPEFAPSSLNLLLNVNRQTRERRVPNK